MDNIRFDTSLMRRIFLMLHLEALDFWIKDGVKEVKRCQKKCPDDCGKSPHDDGFPGILIPKKTPKQPQSPLDLHVDRSPTPTAGTAAVVGVGAIAGMAGCSPKREVVLSLLLMLI
ncbi:unnamed protein product [Bursaphelenchus xylophilus]|uniref:(pine wood nematode) hypothetical protein n=1 Tax=Bursaphelenchus xylophilus TaxID=6326 RepID=A0A811K7N2_BURXY|nr:unnamed protein product [Bursaphelenchus xylophilus]CAG9088207.1 unnamed protein product [Bursaphelenchus xylophilus]